MSAHAERIEGLRKLGDDRVHNALPWSDMLALEAHLRDQRVDRIPELAETIRTLGRPTEPTAS